LKYLVITRLLQLDLHDYGRRRFIGNYDGGKQDALIIVHDMNTEQGIVLGMRLLEY